MLRRLMTNQSVQGLLVTFVALAIAGSAFAWQTVLGGFAHPFRYGGEAESGNRRMRRWMLVGLMLLVAVASTGWTASTQAAGRTVAQQLIIPGLEKALGELTQNDLRHFVELALGNKITVPQAQAFFESLSEQQKTAIDRILDEEAQKYPGYHKPSNQSNSQISFLWQQFIENAWTIGHPPGSTFASSYSTTITTCDNDPDTDFVFYFNFPASNPDGIRWTSDSAQVFAAFGFGKSLNAYGNSFNEVNLCAGDNTVFLAGGADNVKANIFIHY